MKTWGSGEFIFGTFRESKIQKMLHSYRPSVSSFSEVGTYVLPLLLDSFKVAYSICFEDR